MKRNSPPKGPLHNDPTIRAKDAATWRIEASIEWYQSTLATYPREWGGTIIEAPAKWHENLAELKAERANRIGNKKTRENTNR